MSKSIAHHTTTRLVVGLTSPAAGAEVRNIVAAGGGTLSAGTRSLLAQLMVSKLASDEVIAALQAGTGGLSTRAFQSLARGLGDYAAAADIRNGVT